MLATVTHQCYTKAKFKGKLLCCKKKKTAIMMEEEIMFKVNDNYQKLREAICSARLQKK